jgi:type III secretion protein L
MLAKRTLTLGMPVLQEPILRHEHLSDARQAQHILAQAEQQAAAILAAAEQEAQHQITLAVGAFWAGANEFLQGFEQERATYQRQALGTVEQLLNEALGRLLDNTGLPERTRALLRDLAASQPIAAVATLICHPDLEPVVQAWLAESRFAQFWQVQSSSAMAPLALTLSHASGAFDLDWQSLRDGLPVARAEAPATVVNEHGTDALLDAT